MLHFAGVTCETIPCRRARPFDRAEQKQVKEFLRLYARKKLGGEASRIRLKFETADAHPVDAALAAARKSTADLIVMGTHGRGGAKRLWLGADLVVMDAQHRSSLRNWFSGDTTEFMLRHAPALVLIVPH